MTTTSAAPVRTEPAAASVPRLALRLVDLGMLTMPMLVLGVASVTVSEVLFACAAYVLALYPATTRVRVSRLWVIGAVAILLGGQLATVHALDPYVSQVAVLRLGVLLVVGYWIAARCFGSDAAVREALTAYCIGCGISGAVAIAQVVGGLDPTLVTAGRSPALTNHPNDAGASLAIGVIIGLALLGGDRSRPSSIAARWARRALVPCIGLAAIGLLLSGSVTGMISAVTGVVALVLMHRIRFRVVVTAAALLGLALVAASSAQSTLAGRGYAISPTDRIFVTTGGEGEGGNTLASRLETDRAAWDLIVEHPWLGAGLDERSAMVVDDLAPHNVVLLLWYQGGLLVIAGFVAVLVAAWRGWRRGRVVVARTAFGAAAIAALVFGMTAPIFNQLYFWMPLVALAGASAATTGRAGATDEPTEATRQ